MRAFERVASRPAMAMPGACSESWREECHCSNTERLESVSWSRGRGASGTGKFLNELDDCSVRGLLIGRRVRFPTFELASFGSFQLRDWKV